MRYEDTSGSISSSSSPEARDDADTLANGSNGPATGNVITGAGTITGKAGADTPQSGHVVTVRGAGGTDASDNGASLHVDGRFGTLVMDEHGNYKYVADGHAPANFRDLFQYTLADSKGGRSVADLVISRGGEIKVSDNAQKVIPGPDGVVTLPAGVDLNDVHVVGRDLIINMPDGTQIVIVDGAVFVPQLVLGGVEVPSTNLAALLIDAEPRPAAGTTQSSGGNFEVPVAPLDPGVPLGDLIPPTELVFTPPDFHEVNGFINHKPTIEIQPDNQPASVAAVDDVNERGLPTRNGGEPAGSGEIADGNGSNNSDTSETTAGTIIIDSQDTPNSVSINGVLVTGVIGQTIAGDFGTLTITGFNGQNILYSYTLADNTSGDNTHDDFSVTVTDHDGDQATATLTIDIIDDVPTARPDTDAVAAGTYGPETGNVLTGVGTTSGAAGADTVGADNAHISGVTGFNGSADNSAPFVVNGHYGVLTLQTDGSYSYTRNPGTPGGVNDVFNYTLTDGDGDTSTTTLTISIGDATPHTGENPLIRFDDDALPGGNPGGVGDDSPDTVNASGTLAGGGGDGPVTFAVLTTGAPAGFSYVSGGAGVVLIQQGGHTVLTVTVGANGSYSVVQNAPIDHPAGGDENNVGFTINYTVTDQDGDSAPGTFGINVDDDTPTVSLVGEGEPQLTVDETDLTVNATASFAGKFAVSFGADGPAASNSLVYSLGISAPGAASGLIDVATGQSIVLVLNGGVVEGHVGTTGGALAFTVSVDASGTVTLDQIRALQHPDASNPNDNVTLSADNLVTLTATATDHDGDTAAQTLNIGTNLNFHDDGPSIQLSGSEASLTVDETNLAVNDTQSFAGAFTSAFGADGAGTVTYALGISAPGANSGLVDTLTGQAIVLVQNGLVVEGHVGTAAGALAFTVTVDASGNVTLDQIRAVVHHISSNPDTSEGVTLSADNLVTLTATVTDKDGDHQSATLNIGQNLNFLDDGPHANNDTDTVPPAGSSATGNVITGVGTNEGPGNADNAGADQPGHITAIQGTDGTDTTFSGGFLSIHGSFGTLAIDADGNYTYTRDAGAPGSVQDVFTYTLTDADGDSVTATLTININDTAPTGGSVSVGLDDDALAGGNPGGTGDDPDSVNATGTLPGSGGDGALTFGVQLTGAPSGFTYVSGGAGIVLVQQGGTTVLTITVNSATGAYSVVQNHAIDHAPGANENNQAFTVNYTVTDADGDSAPGTINISVDDDTPTISASTTQPTLTVDETNLAINATASFAGVFTNSFGADGPAASNSVTYALAITGGNGVASGLIDVATGSAIVLVNNAGVIEGHVATTGGALAFTVTVDASGNVTLDQIRAVQHPDPNNPNDSVTLANDNLVTLSSTITDHDGDSATATANIGQNLVFQDDGPSISLSGSENSLTVDETNLAVNDTKAFAGAFTSSFGADGAGAVTYALSITGGNGVASGLIDVATGSAIVLVNNAGVIEGHVATTGGALAFTVTVDASGNVTLDQIRAVQHPDPNNPNDSVTLSADNLVVLTATVTDKDGDHQSAALNIGQNLNFLDDGPSIGAGGTQPNLTVDETNLAINASASFAGVFTPSFGADGAGTVTYQMGITGGNGVASGLIDVATGSSIVLVLNGNVVEGHVATTGGALAFTVTVDASGNVTLDQIRAVQHPDPNNPNDSVTLANDNLVTLTATVTDKDGDHQSATANIGQNLNFLDDGPSISASSTQPTLTVDETNLATNATASFVGVFTSSFGADGAGTIGYALSITGGNGVASGLIDVATGSAIVLVNNAGVIEGHVATTGGALAFTVSVDSSGNVTLDQIRAVQHPNASDPNDSVTLANDNLVVLTATITDKDGDHQSAAANIGQNLAFLDDGPSISASTTQPTLTVDETVLATNATASFASVFTSSFGADGAGTITYALGITGGNGVASGLTDTATGSSIVLVLNGNVVEGHVGTTGGPLAFTVSVDSSGNVTLDQIRAVVHTSSNNPDTSEPATLSADNLITLTATITDKDGDHTSATANIGQNMSFLDDGPSIGVVQDQQTDNNPATSPAIGTLHFTPGADGAGSAMTITADNTGIKSGGHSLVTNQVGNVLTAYQDINNNGTYDSGTDNVAVYTVTVNPSAGTSGQYVFDLITPLDPTVTPVDIGGSSSFGAGPTQSQTLNDGGSQNLSVVSGYLTGAGFNEATWLSTGTASGLTLSSVNGSTAGWGIANNNFEGTTEFFNWDFGSGGLDTQGGIFTPPGGVSLPQISFATYDFIGYTTADDITYVVHFTDGTFTSGHVPSANLDSSGPNWVFTAPSGKFIADIEMYTSGTAPGKVDLVNVGVIQSSLDVQPHFTVQLTDGDGDPTASAGFNVHISTGLVPFAPAAPVVLDLNGDGVHFLSSTAGVSYDYGHGAVATAWASPQDGILVNDANHDGQVSASEFVFGGNGVSDLQGLAAYDTNHDGQLSSADAGFGNFAVWQDANSNGAVDAGELQSLTARGIASISLSSDGIRYSAADGDVQVVGTGSYTRADGSTGSLADAEFLTGSKSNSNPVLMGALAAAGLAAESSAAATTVATLAATTALTDIAAQHTQSFAPVALDAVSGTHGSDLLPDTGAPAAPTQTAALHASDAGQAHGLSVAGSESQSNQVPTELLQNSAPVQDAAGAGPSTAASIIMPAAAQLVAAAAEAGVSGAQHNQVLGQVLADALHGGGNGPDIDSVLSSLPNQGGAHTAALEVLASHAGAAVPNGDSSAFAGFTAANAAFTMEHMMVHVDAAPTHA